MGYRPVPLALPGRAPLPMLVDGRAVAGAEGDTVLTVLLRTCGAVRRAEFGPGLCAGFCLMGACQDCWVTLADGRRLRACSTLAEAGMHIVTGLSHDQR